MIRTSLNIFCILIAATLIVFGQQKKELIPESVLSAPEIARCIISTYRIKGICACVKHGIPAVGVIVENAFPTAIVETVKQPFSSSLMPVDEILKQIKQILPQKIDSAGSGEKAKGEGLEFAETHSIYFPTPDLDDLSFLCVPKTIPLAPIYISEIDYSGWRMELFDALFFPAQVSGSVLSCNGLGSNPYLCAGVWGGWYPRTGFVIHPSEPIAMQLLAMRSLLASSAPGLRVTFARYKYPPRTGHYIMPVYPDTRDCYRIGTMLPQAEDNLVSDNGRYMFIHFPIFDCCQPCWGPRLVEPRMP